MKEKIYSVITGSGKYIPPGRISNKYFSDNEFFEAKSKKLDKDNEEILKKFTDITTISERRYASDDLVTSDISYFAAEDAIKTTGIDKEELDYIIVAHNFGNVRKGLYNLDIVPSLAARVKYKLGIKNPYTIAYDIIFGCPGWLQGMIQADYFIRSGDAKKVMVIGAEILSRVCDPHDRDSMLYADGAGAVILEAKTSEKPIGVLTHKTRSDTEKYSQMLYMGESYNPDLEKKGNAYLKMNGRALYQYALENVPQTVKDCLDKSGTHLDQVKKVLIHQANGKMDDAILERLFRLYGLRNFPKEIMPMTIAELGNTSVATLPTLYDIILKGEMEHQAINPGDTIVFASVGAGMNINAMVYQMED